MTSEEFMAILINKQWTTNPHSTWDNKSYNAENYKKHKDAWKLIEAKQAYYPGGAAPLEVITQSELVPAYAVESSNPEKAPITVPAKIKYSFYLRSADESAEFQAAFVGKKYYVHNGIAVSEPILVTEKWSLVDYVRLSQGGNGTWAMVHEIHWGAEVIEEERKSKFYFHDVQMWYCC